MIKSWAFSKGKPKTPAYCSFVAFPGPYATVFCEITRQWSPNLSLGRVPQGQATCLRNSHPPPVPMGDPTPALHPGALSLARRRASPRPQPAWSPESAVHLRLSPCYEPVHGSRHLRAASLPRGALGNSSEGAGTLNPAAAGVGGARWAWSFRGSILSEGVSGKGRSAVSAAWSRLSVPLR